MSRLLIFMLVILSLLGCNKERSEWLFSVDTISEPSDIDAGLSPVASFNFSHAVDTSFFIKFYMYKTGNGEDSLLRKGWEYQAKFTSSCIPELYSSNGDLVILSRFTHDDGACDCNKTGKRICYDLAEKVDSIFRQRDFADSEEVLQHFSRITW